MSMAGQRGSPGAGNLVSPPSRRAPQRRRSTTTSLFGVAHTLVGEPRDEIPSRGVARRSPPGRGREGSEPRHRVLEGAARGPWRR